ncbi:MAG: Lrp/AsnC family transcriptional regulator [Promethearchaeota archaeon]
MSNKKLKLDKIDLRVISLLQEDPNLTHTQIGEIVKRSQPSIGARLKKLKNKGILQVQAGLNFKNLDIQLAIVYLNVKNPTEIIKMVEQCPFMLNAFRTSGEHNMVVLIVNTKIKKIDNIVNHHFRNNSQVQKVSMDVVTYIIKDLVLPMDVESEILEPILEDGCDGNCKYCKLKKVMRFKK